MATLGGALRPQPVSRSSWSARASARECIIAVDEHPYAAVGAARAPASSSGGLFARATARKLALQPLLSRTAERRRFAQGGSHARREAAADGTRRISKSSPRCRCRAREGPLSIVEEHRLSRRWRTLEDETALARLVQAHLGLVIRIAMEFRHSGPSMEDLIQEGNLGLTIAARRFDPSRGRRASPPTPPTGYAPACSSTWCARTVRCASAPRARSARSSSASGARAASSSARARPPTPSRWPTALGVERDGHRVDDAAADRPRRLARRAARHRRPTRSRRAARPRTRRPPRSMVRRRRGGRLAQDATVRRAQGARPARARHHQARATCASGRRRWRRSARSSASAASACASSSCAPRPSCASSAACARIRMPLDVSSEDRQRSAVQ